MNADKVDISGLNAAEKVALMERLWIALSDDAKQMEPPEWHADALAERDIEWEQRAKVAEDWPTVREALRRELQ